MTWISLPLGWVATMSVKKATNSAEVWRCAVRPSTSPVLVLKAAYSDSVPCLKYSKPWRSARPGDKGRTGSLRSSAWMAVFSSTLNTAACCGGFRVQPDHLGRLDLEVRVIGGQIAFHSVRLDPMLGPDATNRHVRDVAQFGRQLTRGPVRRAVARLAFARPSQHARLDPIGHLVALAPSMASEQPAQSIGREALAPAINVAVAAIELGSDLGPSESLRKQKNQTSASCRVGPTVSCIGLPLQLHPFALDQFHHVLRGHDDTS